MAATLGDHRRFPAPAIAGLIADAMAAAGHSAADADTIAAMMVEADLIGQDAHGVFRLPNYMRRMAAGGVNPRPAVSVRRTAPATALVDGDNGWGHVVMSRAAEAAVEIARETGVAWVGVTRSNHAGPASVYASKPVRHGMVGIYSAIASANHMAPWGGVEALLGTNPLAIAIPLAARDPFVLDFATTVVSYGTIKKYALEGRPFPPDWLVSKVDGRPVTDPAQVSESMLNPIGGYKGSGLAIALALLAGTLNGAFTGRDVVDFNADSKSPANTGQFIVALDIARFLDPAQFADAANRFLDDLRASPRLPGVEEIRMPGDASHARRREREAKGVPVPAPLLAQLDALCTEHGLAPLSSRVV